MAAWLQVSSHMKILILLSLISLNVLSRVIDGIDAKEGQYPNVISYEVFADNNMSLCTGTFVSENTIITAAHCLAKFLKMQKNGEEVDLSFPERDMVVKDIVISKQYLRDYEKYEMQLYRTGYDIAFIILTQNFKKYLGMKVNHQKAQLGEAIIVGFGGTLVRSVEEQNESVDPNIGIKRYGKTKLAKIYLYGRIDSKKQSYETSIFDYFFSSSKIAMSSRGDSGGPVIQDGKIIGIISGVDASDQTESKVNSLTMYMAGTHSELFQDLVDEVQEKGGLVLQ